VGGFFLLYMLFVNQPKYPFFHKDSKILITPSDRKTAENFYHSLVALNSTSGYNYGHKLVQQVATAWNHLKRLDAFEYSIFPTAYDDVSTAISS